MEFKKRKGKLRNTIIKALITIILLGFLVFKIKIDKIIEVFSQINLIYVIYAIPFIFMVYILRALKWNALLEGVGIRCKLLENIKVLLIGIFYGMVTPGKSGELVRALYLKERASKVIPTVIWEKIIDIGSLIILSSIAILVLFKNYLIFFVTLGIGLILVIGTILIMNKRIVNLIARFLKFSEESKTNYIENMRRLAKNKNALFKAFFFGLLYYIVSFIPAFFILIAFKNDINPLIVFSLPIIILLGNAPITISGLGLREWVTVLVFQIMNEPSSIGFSFSILWFLMITVIPGIIGYILSMKSH
ncbi:MAG: lysylphosphatidylglycerol synthase transmembrane domain-containing protein [Candidatus Woesearchaeota archaeon]